MNQTWVFRPDHTGETNFYSGRNGRCRTTFEWREAGERTVEVRQIRYEEEYPDPEEAEDAPAEDEEDQEIWVTIAYDFIPVRNEAGGRSVVMVDVDAEREAFGSIFGFFPVSFDGEPHQAGQ
jgi:hypothetical protein